MKEKHMNQSINYHPRTRSNKLLVFQDNNEQLDKALIDNK